MFSSVGDSVADITTLQECRQELALEEIQAVTAIVSTISQRDIEDEVRLTIQEMEKRCDRVVLKLKTLKGKVEQLQDLMQQAQVRSLEQ